MKFLYLWPFFLILLVPIIIIMYLLKQKAVEHPFSSLYLWQEMYRNVEANTPWEKLKKNWLLILQIITMLILIIALASPFLLKGGSGAEHTVIVIDNSASMNTIYADEKTRLDEAIEQAVRYVKDLNAGSDVSVISSAESAVLLVSNTDNKDAIIDKIRTIEPTYQSGNSAAGIEMVRSMQGQWDSMETVCFTDTFVSLENINGYIVDLYSAVQNSAVEYVGHGYNGDALTVLAKVTNFGPEAITTDVNLYGDDELLEIKTVSIAPLESQVVYYEDLDFEGDVLSVEISDKDSLSEDNVCYDVLTEQSENKVLLMTEANLYLEKALSLIDGISITKSNDISSFAEFETENYDLYIFDGMVPNEMPKQGNIIIINGKYPDWYSVSENLDGVMVSAEEKTVTKYIEDFTFGVSSAYSFEQPTWAESFFKVGTSTVGMIGKHDSQTVCVIGFDFHNSDLPLKPEFPLLVYNIISECVTSGMLSTTTITAGEVLQINGKLDEGPVEVLRPSGELTQLSDYVITYTNTQELGIYTAKQQVDQELTAARFAVNFPPSESRITDLPSNLAQVGDQEVKSSVDGVLNLRNVVILIALGLLGVEWIVYLRR